ncbi:glycosyltransferase BC10-like [Tasmannia lanceolata]|uniref:glycosyltransferase BC10-like n=1 Tax=Tasmannia lanceolata TaxID=3420 RepID=UPI004063126C
MLSPTPFSLCCALLLCLPVALFFSVSSTTITTICNPNSNSNKSLSTLPFPNDKNKNKTTPFIRPLPQDDAQLFHLASHVNPNPIPSTPNKIAFMFLTTSSLPFTPLWQRYFFPNQSNPQTHIPNPNNLFNIYIHSDPSNPQNSPFTGIFSNRTIPSKPTLRSHPSLISAARRLLANALLHDPSNSMFALLSPTCIPLHSFPFTYKILIRSKKSFIEILKDEPGIKARYIARGEDTMLPEVPIQSFRVGSQFFVLARRHAMLVVNDTRLWRKFNLPCKSDSTCYPEEHYFPTLLSMRDPLSCVPATLTHVDWRGTHGGHPRTYNESQVGPELIRSLRGDRPRYGDGGSNLTEEYPFLFARKFSPEGLEKLMEIADDVIFRD